MEDYIDLLRKINKTVVHEDGTLDSFDKQLIKLMSGVYDVNYPMIVAENTNCISYVDTVDMNLPLLMNVSTVIKIKDKHEIGYEFVSNCKSMLKESVLAFESLTHKSSVIILLNEFDLITGNPILAICRQNKDVGVGGFEVNEITSIYDKERFLKFLIRTYMADKTFYKNEKTEQYFTPHGLQLPDDIKYALSDNYYKPSFTKSQVENELKSKKITSFGENVIPLDQRIAKASDEAHNQQEESSRSVEHKKLAL